MEEIQHDDELAELLTHSERLRTQVTDIQDTIDDQTEHLSTVRSDLGQASATMEEIAATTTQVADAVETAAETAREGQQAGESASEAAHQTASDAQDLIETMERVASQMDDISKVTELIAEIADQTNMLALNANIEAARAGEDGAGFAVVADEVKTLAEETGENADEIQSMIGSLVTEADEGLTAAKRTQDSVEATVDDIDAVMSALDEIVDRIEEAASGAAEIDDANTDQARTIDDLADQIERIGERAQTLSDRIGEVDGLADRQETIVEHASDFLHNLPGMGYRVKNDDGWPTQFATEGTKQLTGYDSEQLTSGEISLGEDIIHPEDGDAVWAAVQEALDDRREFDMSYRIVTVHDEVIHIRERGRGVYDDAGNVVAVEGYIWNPDDSATKQLARE